MAWTLGVFLLLLLLLLCFKLFEVNWRSGSAHTDHKKIFNIISEIQTLFISKNSITLQIKSFLHKLVTSLLSFLTDEIKSIIRCFHLFPFLFWSAHINISATILSNLIQFRYFPIHQYQYFLQRHTYKLYTIVYKYLPSEALQRVINAESFFMWTYFVFKIRRR